MFSLLYLCICIVFFTISGVSTRKPNVLFIVVDDLRPALGCYKYKNAFTPNIDKLAASSFVFNNAFAQQALCAPSRNSFLTSRRPDTLHLYDFYSYWRTFAGNFTTLPQHFKENGYHTKSIGKIFHPGVSSNFTDDYPLSWSEVPFHPKTEQFKNAKVCLDKRGNLAQNLICPVLLETQPLGTLPDLESLQEAITFLKRQNESYSPYFLAVGFHKPHVPLKFPLKYLDYHPLDNIKLPVNRYRPSLLPTVAWNPWNDVRSRDDMKLLNISFPFGPMPDQTMKMIIQAYNAAVTYIDDLIGQLLKHVDNNTLIIFTADHGWSLGEHGEISKFSNFQVAIRVPLIVHLPQTKHTTVHVDSLVELVDLFPTLVDLTKVSEPLKKCPYLESQVDLCTEGKSFFKLMMNRTNEKDVEKSAIFSQYPRPGIFPTKKPDSDRPRLKDIKIMGYSMRTTKFRYSEWVGFHQNFSVDWSQIYGKELYDLAIDPDENMNLSGRPELQYIEKMLDKQLKLGWRYAQ